MYSTTHGRHEHDLEMLAHIHPACPFDCCLVWKGAIPIPPGTTRLSTDEYLAFMEEEKRKLVTFARGCKCNSSDSGGVESTSSPAPCLPTTLAREAAAAGVEMSKHQYQEQYQGPWRSITIPYIPNRHGPEPDLLKENTRSTPTWKTTPVTPVPALTINLVACSICGSYCLSENDLTKHMASQHGNAIAYENSGILSQTQRN